MKFHIAVTHFIPVVVWFRFQKIVITTLDAVLEMEDIVSLKYKKLVLTKNEKYLCFAQIQQERSLVLNNKYSLSKKSV